MSQTYEQVEIASETVVLTERRGATGRNGGGRRAGTEEGIVKVKVRKNPVNHNSKLETMNTERDYDQVQDEIPTQDDITTIIKVDGWKKARKSKKIVVVEPKEDIAVASEITIEVAVPLTLEEGRFARVDAVAEPDEVIAVMTEEDCLMAEAEIMMKKAEELKKEAQRRIAEKKLRENVGELREKVLLPKRELAERLRDEILRKQRELGKLMTEIEDIEEGAKDDELVETELETKVIEPKAEKAVRVKVEGKRAPPTKKECRSSVLFEDEELFRHNATRGGVLLNTIYCYYESATDRFQLCDEESNPIIDGDDVVSENGITFGNLNQFIIYNNRQYVPEKVQRETAWAGSVCVFRDEWISVGKLQR